MATVATTESNDSARSQDTLRVVALPVDQLVPNSYNPNALTAAEFAELVAEVRHLGRLPKPVIVRPQGDHWLIVDGEHGWRAAREVGLTVVPCEVVDADDFEAMRQTFKRNQHGTHNPIKLGQMFTSMMAQRGLSQRGLAQDIGVSEGTIRNALLYAEAADLRSDYAAAADVTEDAEASIGRLAVRQVRAYVGLPAPVRDVWLAAGADPRALAQAALVTVRDEDTGTLRRIDWSGEAGSVDGWEAHKVVPERTRKSNRLQNQRLKPKQTPRPAVAEMMVGGLGANAATAIGYSKMLGELDLIECGMVLVAETRKVQGGNLAGLEAILTAQVVTLNAMFTQLAYQASQMTIVDQIDRFTRLALKAQGQCRATVETLAAIKNPPVVFARQANIAHGPQQVNNAELQVPSRAENQETEQIKLLEAHGERLDLGTTGTTGARDPAMATVGMLNRPANQ